MGYLCGWSGVNIGYDASLQTMKQMLCSGDSPAAIEHQGNYYDKGSLAVNEGIHATSFHEQNGISAVLVGSPYWEDENLAQVATNHGTACSLVKAYRDHGKNFLKQLHGPFALAVMEADTVLIAIDRIGIRTLSYAYRDGVFVFATSTKGVISHPKVRQAIDPQAIYNYFYFYDIPGPGTIYQGVNKVLPAQYVLFRNGRIEKGLYWQLNYNDHEQTDFQKDKTRFEQLLRTAVGSSRDDSPATFLSGGTDSSTITGVLAEIVSNPVDTYSIGFDAEGFDEMEYARIAARHFGTRTHEYYIQPDDILEAIPLITQAYDEPFGNESAVPTYFCAKLAAQNGVKAILAGDGGDEIFGGNERYAKQMVFEHYTKLPSFLRKRLLEPLIFNIPGSNNIFPIRKLNSYVRQAKIPLPERMESYNFIHRQPLAEIFRPEFLSAVNTGMPEELLREVYFGADSSHPINRMLHLDLKFTLADNDLRKVSRMCEIAGTEVHYPILDERLVEFAASLPPNNKVRGQKLRWFFKEALKDFLPVEIVKKSKHGFGLPFGIWSLSHPPLKELVDNSLKSLEQKEYIQPAYIQNLRRLQVEEHPTYYGKMIWVMLMLEKWLEAHA